jgi:(1->4)-alpha-D-glucan 1-alpha-D-glucosylmutase
MDIPSATYRLQLQKDFGFAQLREIVDYLHALGISHVYASPMFMARPGSMHGYDVVDPNRINPEIGTREEFDRLSDHLRRRGIGWVQDIVPNHMAYDCRNRMLMDVLENGRNSMYADFFDIEWDHPVESLRGKVLAPSLGKFYGAALEDGELVLRYDEAGLAVYYFDQRFPISPESYGQVLTPNLAQFRRKLGRNHPDLIKLLGVIYSMKNLPSAEESRERADQIVFIKSMLWELYNSNSEIKTLIDENIAALNGRPGEPESFNALDQLLSQQAYRLSFWKVASEEINYRRFFNINELISLRMEDPRVFDETHALVLQLVSEGKINGLRIDHIDGLYDPLAYLTRLRGKSGDSYIVVEKILDLDEQLPRNWPVAGTTGYEFTDYVAEIFCQRENEEKFSQLYTRFARFDPVYADLVTDKKRLIIGKYMAGDVDRLANLLKRVSSRDRFGGDITLYGLKRALVEVLAFFPVYRTYVTAENFSDEDRHRIQSLMAKTKELNPGLIHELSFIEKFLLLDYGEHVRDEEKAGWVRFVMRLQQLTGPLMAKGFEDTTLYIYNRLISLNEVGGNPSRFGLTLDEFHRFNEERQRDWPHCMNATATHDTKRGEDARARIDVLSEMPDQWEEHITKWHEINRRHKQLVKGREFPDRNDEYFLYQSLVGSWPVTEDDSSDFTERVKAYIIKAVREAKVHTEWLKPDAIYEEAFTSFIDKILAPAESNEFLSEFTRFAGRAAFFGALNSLSQTLLKIASPGMPDFYQGTELWQLSFVDPDNRRPVDFAKRKAFLDELSRDGCDAGRIRKLLEDWKTGEVKLFLTCKALQFRRSHPAVFESGNYIPVTATGALAANICAFARRNQNEWIIAVAPRFVSSLVEGETFPLGDCWRETSLELPNGAPRRWTNVFTEKELPDKNGAGVVPLSGVFDEFPVGLLAGKD